MKDQNVYKVYGKQIYTRSYISANHFLLKSQESQCHAPSFGKDTDTAWNEEISRTEHTKAALQVVLMVHTF